MLRAVRARASKDAAGVCTSAVQTTQKVLFGAACKDSGSESRTGRVRGSRHQQQVCHNTGHPLAVCNYGCFKEWVLPIVRELQVCFLQLYTGFREDSRCLQFESRASPGLHVLSNIHLTYKRLPRSHEQRGTASDHDKVRSGSGDSEHARRFSGRASGYGTPLLLRHRYYITATMK
jgi:hypothetical protein